MATDARRTRWLRAARNGAIVLVVLFVLFGVVGFLIAPGIVRNVAEQQIAEQTGRKATIGAVRLNPYALSATIDDFKLYEPDGKTVAVQVEQLFANVSSASLFRRALVFDALRVTRPKISVVRLAPQRFSFSDIVDKVLAKPKSDSTLHYSLNNIELDNGSIAFDDRVTGRRHVVDHIAIGLPFLSDLPYATEITVTPKFAAVVNGSALELHGEVQPFAHGREASIDFDVTGLDVPSYLDFAPTPLRFKVTSAKLDTKLHVLFRAAAQTADGKAISQSLSVSGTAALTDLKIADGAREVIAVKRIDVDAQKIEPLLSAIALRRVAIVEPRIAVTRRPDGSLDLVDLFAPASTTPSATASTPASTTAAAKPATPPASGPKPVVTIAAASLDGGRIDLTDASFATPATTTLDAIDLKLDRVALQGDAPMDFALSLNTADDGRIETKGSAVVARRKASGTFRMRHFRPGAFSNYIATFVAARIGDGTVDVDAHYDLDASGPELLGKVDRISARIAQLRSLLPNEKTPFVAAEAIALDGASYDFPTHAFAADALTLTAPVVSIARDAKGRLNLQTAVIEKAPATARATTEKDVAVVVQPVDAKPFTAIVKRFAIERGNVSFEDASQGAPVRIQASPLNFTAENVGTTAGAVVPFSLDTGVDKRGKLVVQGKLTAAPLSIDASVVASNVAVGWLAGYAGERLNVVLESADLNARGAVRLQPAASRRADAPPDVTYQGSLGVSRLRALDRVTSEEFVRWKTLDIPQVDFRMPAKNASMSVALGAVALDDFYARIIVNANGRLNLQDVVATPGQQQSVTNPEADGTPNPAPAVVAKKNAASAQVAPAAAPAGPQPMIRVKGVRLTHGRIGITDNFVKPNYSANLTDLVGEVSAIAPDAAEPAELKLNGKIDGDGALTVSGKLDPLAPIRYTDISAEAKDIELTRLSPYAIKYAGYAIERGKLSMTVKYHIDQGKLDASNRLFLDQLTFGEKVDSPTATKLPVLLAVSLLKNSRGEIDVNLPISGSLTDPQFSIGSVIGRVIVNLLTRAVTSPFSLLASTVGGGAGGADELGYVQFKPGVSDMTPQGKAKLETLAKALADRPALKLDIIGRFDPATDPDGIKRDHLLDRLKDLKAKDLSKSGDRVGRDDVTIEPNEYATYLARVYDDTKLPDKPRNVVGLAKTLPVDEMEKLLLANMKLDENDPRWLAEARADVVRHYIEDTGKVAPSRVFLVTPKLNANGIDDKGAPNRVDFALR